MASQYIDGIAIHWYESAEDRLTWLTKPFKRIRETNKLFPNKFIFATEACMGSMPTIPFIFKRGPVLGSWYRGEIYAYDIINDLNAGVTGWNDWNISLDMNGGVNWAQNNVDAPIIVDTETGETYYKQPMFFFMGHFSKFLPRDSRRVETTYVKKSLIGRLGFGFEPYITSFVRPDNKLVVTILNMGFWQKDYELRLSDGRIFSHSIKKHSIQSILFSL